MQSLPNELIIVICNYITKITDKRKFTQTCKMVYKITLGLIQNAKLELEALCNDNIISMNPEINKFKQLSYNCEHCVENFTLELCYDSYFDLIPKSYLKRNNSVIVKVLAMYGQFKLLKQAIKNNCKLDKITDDPYDFYLENTCNQAVISGNLDMVKDVILRGCKPDKKTCMIAAEFGHLHILKFLKEYNYNFENEFACNEAAFNGNFKILKWLINNNYPMDDNICDRAASGGHINIIKWLMDNYGCTIDEGTCEAAIIWGQLDTLKWLIKQKCSMNLVGCYCEAGSHNQYHIIKWLKENNYEMNSSACAGAANSGHLDMLIWDEHVCEMAARYGKLNILKWLRQNGCPWNADTCAWAANNGYLEVLKWAVENGCKCDSRALEWAGKNKHVDICNWLKENL